MRVAMQTDKCLQHVFVGLMCQGFSRCSKGVFATVQNFICGGENLLDTCNNTASEMHVALIKILLWLNL